MSARYTFPPGSDDAQRCAAEPPLGARRRMTHPRFHAGNEYMIAPFFRDVKQILFLFEKISGRKTTLPSFARQFFQAGTFICFAHCEWQATPHVSPPTSHWLSQLYITSAGKARGKLKKIHDLVKNRLDMYILALHFGHIVHLWQTLATDFWEISRQTGRFSPFFRVKTNAVRGAQPRKLYFSCIPPLTPGPRPPGRPGKRCSGRGGCCWPGIRPPSGRTPGPGGRG